MRKITSFLVLATFIVSCIMPPQGFAQSLSAVGLMPLPGNMVAVTPAFTPAHLWGMAMHPNDPFKFDFLIHRGNETLTAVEKTQEYTKLIKYFLAALAVPDTDQWVNLSPYEKDRIIPNNFGLTEMGRDLLAQDYLLKQLASSLTDPESQLGKKFWDHVYAQAHERFGTTSVPTDVFNKVWIMPDKAVVFEKDNTVYVLENHLKVMTDKDYLAARHNVSGDTPAEAGAMADISSQVMKEVIIPAIETEVNEGKGFAPLRQVYSGMLLATWYKRTLKESILGKLYADKGKVKGVDQDPRTNQEIYNQYLQAFQKGVFNMIKEDVDNYTQEVIPRKYFSGGTVGFDHAALTTGTEPQFKKKSGDMASQTDVVRSRLTSLAEAAVPVLPSTTNMTDVMTAWQNVNVPSYDQLKTVIDVVADKFGAVQVGLLRLMNLEASAAQLFADKLHQKDSPAELFFGLNVDKLVSQSVLTPDGKSLILTIDRKRSLEALATAMHIDIPDNAAISALKQGILIFSTMFGLSVLSASNVQALPKDSIGLAPASIRIEKNIAFTKEEPKKLLPPGNSGSFVVQETPKAVLFIKRTTEIQKLPVGTFVMIARQYSSVVETTWKPLSGTSLRQIRYVQKNGGPWMQQIKNSEGSIIIQHRMKNGFVPGMSRPFIFQGGTIKQEVSTPGVFIYKETSTKKVIPANTSGKKPGDLAEADQVDNAALKGGIDFAQSNLDMQIKRDGAGVPLPLSQQNLDNIKIDGLVPEILSIQPAVSVPLFSEAQGSMPSAA